MVKTSFHAEKCHSLVSAHKAFAHRIMEQHSAVPGLCSICIVVAENHRLQSAYDNHLITKLIVVSSVSSRFCYIIIIIIIIIQDLYSAI